MARARSRSGVQLWFVSRASEPEVSVGNLAGSVLGGGGPTHARKRLTHIHTGHTHKHTPTHVHTETGALEDDALEGHDRDSNSG
jgi:hypothetical protein